MSFATGSSKAVCVVRCGGMLYGLPAVSIGEVLDWKTPWPVPLAPRHVAGVIAYQGDVLTVIRLGSLLHQGSSGALSALVVLQDPLTAERFALAVDRVDKVISVAEAAIEPNPPTLGPEFQAMFAGLCRCEGEPLVLLNLSSLTPDRLFQEFGPPDEAAYKGAPCAH